MQIELGSSAKKAAVWATFFLATAAYITLAAAQCLAAYFSHLSSPILLKRAIWLDPANAEARYRFGRFELLAEQSPLAALPWLQSATKLNPHNGRYWVDFAAVQSILNNGDSAAHSLQTALQVDPHTPDIAWDAANLYNAQGENDKAMEQLHSVLENAPELTGAALRTCWGMRSDVDYLLDNVVPPRAYPAFLQFLITRNEIPATARVWEELLSSKQTLEHQDLFDYVRYLILHHEPAQAARVWQEAAGMASLQAYQPSSVNLMVNGDFGLDILDGGFDWVHWKTEGASLALDPAVTHSGARSLRMIFDGPGIADAGISQVVAVKPSTSYEFSAFYKSEDMDGAGGMEFAIQDAYTAKSFFMSEDLRSVDWMKAGGSFTTGPDTDLLMIRIVRRPSGSPIRGKLWIDGLRLVETSTIGSENVASGLSSRSESQ